jgi:predicted DNA-binding protein (MmcQ/YjbR family)
LVRVALPAGGVHETERKRFKKEVTMAKATGKARARSAPKPKNGPRPMPVRQPKSIKREHPLLRKLSEICLSLPEAVRRDLNDHADFRVRGKVFAYFLNNHHGDGIVSICCKSAMGENVDRASREPARFYLPAYIGPRGWFGLRLDGEAIDWSEVRNLLELSYELVAPKRLLLGK